jgi:two-component system response regulator HydG
MNYDWPGNLREMKNTIKRSVLLTKTSTVPIDVLPQEMRSAIEQENAIPYYSKENEESAIRSALEKAGFNKTKAAKLLNIDRKTLYNKLKLYSIDL